MKCLNCGQENPDGTKFCTSCGTKFEEKKEEKSSTLQNPFAVEAPTSTTENTSDKSNTNSSNVDVKKEEITQENVIDDTTTNNVQQPSIADNNVQKSDDTNNRQNVQTSEPKPNIVLGILSIVFAPLVSLAGLILGIISIVKAKKIKKVSKDAKVTPMFVLGGVGIGLSVISMIVSTIVLISVIGMFFAAAKIGEEFDNSDIKDITNKIQQELNNSYEDSSKYTTSELEIEFDGDKWTLNKSSLLSDDQKVKINLPTSSSEESGITSDMVTSPEKAYEETVKVITSDKLKLGKGTEKYIKIDSSNYYMSVDYTQAMSEDEDVYGKIYVVAHKVGTKNVFYLYKTFFYEEDYEEQSDVDKEVIDMIENTKYIGKINNSNSDKNVVNSDEKEESKSDIVTKESSKDSPIEFGEYGMASRYSKSEYVDVPVKLTNITRGEEAAKIVKEYCENGSSIYKYTEPKTNMEWAVIEYQADLTNVYEYTMGRSVRVDSAIKGIGGGSLKYNDVTYFLSTVDMSESYSKKTIANGKFAVQLPVGCTDYMIVMGSSISSATKAYFKGK